MEPQIPYTSAWETHVYLPNGVRYIIDFYLRMRSRIQTRNSCSFLVCALDISAEHYHVHLHDFWFWPWSLRREIQEGFQLCCWCGSHCSHHYETTNLCTSNKSVCLFHLWPSNKKYIYCLYSIFFFILNLGFSIIYSKGARALMMSQAF